MRKMIIYIMTLALAIGIVGCGSDEGKDSGKTNKKRAESTSACTLNILANYGGYGEDGTDLGSGSFNTTLEIKEGDVFYETYDGNWVKESNDGRYVNILTVERIKEDGVTVKVDKQRMNIKYGSKLDVWSTICVCDGINYSYVIEFSEYRK